MVIRVEKNKYYTTMSNYHLWDKKLSLKAKGLMSFMLSLPEDWDYTVMGLVACLKEGRDGIRVTIQELENHGCICMEVPLGADEHLDLNALMHTLAQCEIDSVLLEGGATLNAAALQAQIVQELHVYIGTKILGGKTSPSPVGGTGVKKPAQAYRLRNMKYNKLGGNILLKAKIDYSKCK